MVENEIQYLSWPKFQRMAPAIVQLELRRMERLMITTCETPALHNVLVRARIELERFMEHLDRVDRAALETDCGGHLRRAILLISALDRTVDEQTFATLSYIGERLNYVHDRMVLLY